MAGCTEVMSQAGEASGEERVMVAVSKTKRSDNSKLLSRLTPESASLMSSSPTARTSRTQTRPRRSLTPPHNTKKRTLPPHNTAKRRVPTPDLSEGSDDRYEYISIVESEDSSSDIDQLATPSPKAPVRRTQAPPDDGITPRRRAKRKHYYRYGTFGFVYPHSHSPQESRQA